MNIKNLCIHAEYTGFFQLLFIRWPMVLPPDWCMVFRISAIWPAASDTWRPNSAEDIRMAPVRTADS